LSLPCIKTRRARLWEDRRMASDTPAAVPPAVSPALSPLLPATVGAGASHAPLLQGLDRLLATVDSALRTVWGQHSASRACPQADTVDTTPLNAEQQREAAALMRVNHVGEVCAQALYASQAWGTRDPRLKAHFEAAAREETDHLAWTEQRLRELGGRTSLLNPLWYAGAFGIGLLAARAGDAISLGLNSHLDRLAPHDHASRVIVAAMRDDEVAHAKAAQEAGGVQLPAPVRGAMKLAAKVMTLAAHRI
jgi:ubiquinone biosynthesis monooxygenase Coq7